MVKCLPITYCHECTKNVLTRRNIPITQDQVNQYLEYVGGYLKPVSIYLSPNGFFMEKDCSTCGLTHKETSGKIPDWCPLKDVS